MVTDCTHCPSCGAPVDLTARSCPYCGVPYPKPRKTLTAAVIGEPCKLHIDAAALSRLVEDAIITPNEARRRMGLPPV